MLEVVQGAQKDLLMEPCGDWAKTVVYAEHDVV